MIVTNSYIFLEKENKNSKIKKYKDNKYYIELSENFFSMLKNTFEDFKEDNVESKLALFYAKGSFKITYNENTNIVLFDCYNVKSNYYLNITIKGTSKSDVISTLEVVNEKLIGKENLFNKRYVSIISYDYISKYYCKKLYPFFNEFERKLRRLLLNIYTLNFEMDYYSELAKFLCKYKLELAENVDELKDKKKDIFYDLVAKESPNKYKVSGDIAEYIMKNECLRNFIRIAKNKKLDNIYWKNKIKELEREG